MNCLLYKPDRAGTNSLSGRVRARPAPTAAAGAAAALARGPSAPSWPLGRHMLTGLSTACWTRWSNASRGIQCRLRSRSSSCLWEPRSWVTAVKRVLLQGERGRCNADRGACRARVPRDRRPALFRGDVGSNQRPPRALPTAAACGVPGCAPGFWCGTPSAAAAPPVGFFCDCPFL